MSVWDISLDDGGRGPELSSRAFSAFNKLGLKTVGDMRDALKDGRLKQVKQVGQRTLYEITECVRHYEEIETPDLFQTPEHKHYLLEDRLGTIQALIHDVERILQRAALKGAISQEARKDAGLKLRDASNYVYDIPLFSRSE